MTAHGSHARHGGKLADDARRMKMATRPAPHDHDACDAMRRHGQRLARESWALDPRETLALARALLARIEAEGADYADFQAAQYVGRQVGKAHRLLQSCD